MIHYTERDNYKILKNESASFVNKLNSLIILNL